MLLCLLQVILLMITVFSYSFGRRELTFPPFLFSLGFAVSTACAIAMAPAWGLSIRINTFIVLVAGATLFTVCACCIHVLFFKRKGGGDLEAAPKVSTLPLDVRILPLLFALGIQIIVLLGMLYFVSNWYPEVDLFTALGRYKEALTFSTQAPSFPFPLKQLVNFDKAAGYVFAFLLAECVELKHWKKASICAANVLLVAFLGLVVGGRFLALSYPFMAFVILMLLRYRNEVTRLPRSMIISVICFGAVFVLMFQMLSFGRSGSLSFFEYLSIYLGAPISNLNHYLQLENLGGSIPFGRMTFYCLYTYIGLKFGITEWQYNFDLPFLSSNGFSMGNVYTTYYSFLYDFGYVGLIVLVVVMATISQFVYEKARRGTGKFQDLWILFSAFISYQLIFSFFSDKFYEEIVSPGFITMSVYLLIARYFLCHFNIREFASKGFSKGAE